MHGLKKKFADLRTTPSEQDTRPTKLTVPNSSTADNATFFQGFEWYLPSDGQHYQRLARCLESLTRLGVDQVWLPPGCKAGWQGSNGYDIYDLYDLGEFDQKGHRGTKFGDKKALADLSKLAQSNGVKLCWDAVLNHKCAADYTEKCQAVKVDQQDRLKNIGGEHEVEVWTGYNFDGRNDKYSSFKYHWHHFTGTDWEARLQTNDDIYRFVGRGKPGWAKDVDDTFGNYDYLMGNNLDHSQIEVRDDLHVWGEWIVNEVGLSGFRLDAVKHMSQSFLKEWIQHLDEKFQRRLFFVGEYWRGDLEVLGPVIEKFNGRLHLFDVALAGNMSKMSHDPVAADLRNVFDGTLTKHYPGQAVTFILNHDTQPRYERDHHVVPISSWFIPLGYALILLRHTPSYPCVFYGDLFGIQSPDPQKMPHLAQPPSCWGALPKLMLARKMWAYGQSREYFDDAKCVGFTRLGLEGKVDGGQSKLEGLAVVLNIGDRYAKKEIFVGKERRGQKWTDLLDFAWGEVDINEDGYGIFPVGPRSVSVWLNCQAVRREQVDELTKLPDIYGK